MQNTNSKGNFHSFEEGHLLLRVYTQSQEIINTKLKLNNCKFATPCTKVRQICSKTSINKPPKSLKTKQFIYMSSTQVQTLLHFPLYPKKSQQYNPIIPTYYSQLHCQRSDLLNINIFQELEYRWSDFALICYGTH